MEILISENMKKLKEVKAKALEDIKNFKNI